LRFSLEKGAIIMKKFLTLSLGLMLTVVLTAPVNAWQDDSAVSPAEESQVQSDQGQTQAQEQMETSDQGAQNDPAVMSNGESQVPADQSQSQAPEPQGTVGQATPTDPSMSLDARYKQRIENKNRAAEMRQKLMSEGEGQALTPQQPPQ
jgi:hypothetical protein